MELEVAVGNGQFRAPVWGPGNVGDWPAYEALVVVNVDGSCRAPLHQWRRFYVGVILLVDVDRVVLQNAVLHVLR